METPKFSIGQTVYNTVSQKGSYGPSVALRYTKLKIDGIETVGDDFIYTCGYEGWKFKENELVKERDKD